MSPEVIGKQAFKIYILIFLACEQDQNATYDSRSDLWSVGITALEVGVLLFAQFVEKFYLFGRILLCYYFNNS
jgi:serine/threonine protein kinase